VLPRWLAEQQVKVVIAGGMGERARRLLEQAGVTVVLGASDGTPEELAARWLAGRLSSRGGSCTAHAHGCDGR
jgi:predicted Fe-Mo cluster-binding NifX family protein